ncbi:MAG TPA: hypothetical protein VGF99_05650, partial [Myxococcota bacterium]
MVARGTSLLSGSAFGDVAFVADRAVVGDTPRALLQAVDVERADLATDERIVFLLGYEACCALLPGVPLRAASSTASGPAFAAWRGRVTAPLHRDVIEAPTLRLSTTSAR